MRKNIFLFLIFAVLLSGNAFSDVFNPLGTENCFLGLDRQTGFLVMSGSALCSFLISEFLSEAPHMDYYQVHGGYYYGNSGGPASWGPETTDSGSNYHVVMQNFGIEREFSRWFSMILEANVQEFAADDYFAMGIGLKTYMRWTLLRKYVIHPYFEYGAGVFCAFSDFPENGSHFTFNLNYAVGAEYILPNDDKIRLDWNFKHHSNNNFCDSNPGFDSNGVSLSYCWYWKEKEKKYSKFWKENEEN